MKATAKEYDLIPLEEARMHLRVGDDTSQDAMIRLKLEGATDIAETFVNRILREKTVTMSALPAPEIPLKITPVNGIERVYFTGADGTDVTVQADDYRLDDDEYAPGISFLRVPQAGRIGVVLRCGYTAQTLPPAIRMGILLILGTLYDNESDNLVGRSVSELPMSAERILAPWRITPY